MEENSAIKSECLVFGGKQQEDGESELERRIDVEEFKGGNGSGMDSH